MFNFNKKTNIEKIPIPLFYQLGGEPPANATYIFEYYLSSTQLNFKQKHIATETFRLDEMITNGIFPPDKLTDLAYSNLNLDTLSHSFNSLLSSHGIANPTKDLLIDLLQNKVDKQSNINILRQGNIYTIKIYIIDRQGVITNGGQAARLNNLTRQTVGGGYGIKIPIPVHLF